MKITESQKKHLRALGHKLKPVLLVGNAGLSESVIAEANHALTAHELIKVRLRVGGREQRDAAIATLCDRTGAALVQRIGNTALVYRPDPDTPRIK